MAKKNWRDSGKSISAPPAPPAPKANWGASNAAPKQGGMGGAGKVLFLLATAAMLGGLIAVYRQFLIPEVKTPILFCDAYPSSEGERILSTNAGAIETQKRLAEDTHDDLDTKPANLRTISDVSINARQKVAFFYLYADMFVANDQQPYLLSHDRRAGQSWDSNAVQPSANTELRKFLEDVCRLEMGECPRIVVLDCGRLDAPAFSQIHPDATGAAVQTVLDSLREAKVPHMDKLWVLAATDDYQLGWTSPELGGSVFGYFFSAGLRGHADANEDGSVTLAELNLFVQDSVARWVENYRDCVQTPRLFAGGDLQVAESIHVVFPHSAEYESVKGFAVSQTAHDALWGKVFALPQPHRRQMATARLVRLEQLRFCESKEYPQLLQQIQTILHESDTTTVLKLPVSPDLWDDQFRDQHNVAFEPEVMSDFTEFLAAPSPSSAVPAAQPKPASATEQNRNKSAGKEKQTGDGAAASEANGEESSSQESAAGGVLKPKMLGSQIENLTSPQRLAVVWQHLRSRPAGSRFDQTQMNESMDFVLRGDSANPACDDWVQMQFLDLLQRSLPWGKQDFDPAIPIAAIKCFEVSQRLAGADLPQRRGPAAGDASGNRIYRAWLEWRHVQPAFDSLENRRRYALDAAIAGDSTTAIREFQTLVAEYDELRKQWGELTNARSVATNLLFVVPYLKSFVVRDTAYRQHQQTGARTFVLPLKQLAELEQSALEMQSLLSGRVMTAGDLKRLSVLKISAVESANGLRDACNRIADEATQAQSASQYAFAAMSLLSTPIPEWIDQRNNSATSATRSIINKRLEKQLGAQQQAFFQNPAAAERRTEDQIDSIRQRQKEIVVAQLKQFENAFAELKPVSTADLNLAGSANWNEVQQSLENLTQVDSLRNSLSDQADFVFVDGDSMDQEILRLDAIDRQLRVADPLLGLAETPSELYQQQIRLHQFAAEYRLAHRALDDFWGSGNVKKMRGRVPAVQRQIRLHVRNMEEVAGESGAFRLAGKMYSAYDAGSLKQLATDLAKTEQALWSDFSQLEPQWKFNSDVLPLTQLGLTFNESTESATGARLGMELDRIGEVLDAIPYRPSAGASTMPQTGTRISLERKKYFQDLDVPISVRNARAAGEVVYRGHQFFRELAVSRKIVKKLPPETFVFRPKFRPRDTAMVTVENDVKNEVNLVFLIDCSGSMKGETLKKVKEATREIMLELVREKRFHIGLAAFAHRGEFTGQRNDGKLVTVGGRFPIKGDHHPFTDWEMLVKAPDSISDEQFVNDLCELHLDPLQPRGFTPLYYSIAKTLPMVNNTDRKNILVVVTDGIDSQYPDQFPNDLRAEPKGVNGGRVRPTTINELNQAYQRFAGKVNVLVLETKRNINNQMPADFTSVALGKDTATDMKTQVLDFVGRYKFSVTKAGVAPTEKDLTQMGETVFLKVTPDSEYLIQTHGVPTGQSQQSVTLSGGEDLEFINTTAGLRLSRAQLAAARDGFLPPRINDSLQLGRDSYLVGRRQSNQLNNVRIGFANKRGLSQFPGRVWAHVRDAKGREFAMVTTTREFSEVPTYNFQMPSGFRETEIEMTLYVQPRGANSAPAAGDAGEDAAEAEDKLAYREISGEDGGEFRGLKYEVVQNEDSQTRFTATITSADGPIVQDFQLEAPGSVPIPDSGWLHSRTVVYEDVQRIKEVFEFEIPTEADPVFRLTVQTPTRWAELSANGPAVGKSKPGIDPIFGDEVIVVELGKLRVKN